MLGEVSRVFDHVMTTGTVGADICVQQSLPTASARLSFIRLLDESPTIAALPRFEVMWRYLGATKCRQISAFKEQRGHPITNARDLGLSAHHT